MTIGSMVRGGNVIMEDMAVYMTEAERSLWRKTSAR
jgi:hypothetical protein